MQSAARHRVSWIRDCRSLIPVRAEPSESALTFQHDLLDVPADLLDALLDRRAASALLTLSSSLVERAASVPGRLVCFPIQLGLQIGVQV